MPGADGAAEQIDRLGELGLEAVEARSSLTAAPACTAAARPGRRRPAPRATAGSSIKALTPSATDRPTDTRRNTSIVHAGPGLLEQQLEIARRRACAPRSPGAAATARPARRGTDPGRSLGQRLIEGLELVHHLALAAPLLGPLQEERQRHRAQGHRQEDEPGGDESADRQVYHRERLGGVLGSARSEKRMAERSIPKDLSRSEKRGRMPLALKRPSTLSPSMPSRS